MTDPQWKQNRSCKHLRRDRFSPLSTRIPLDKTGLRLHTAWYFIYAAHSSFAAYASPSPSPSLPIHICRHSAERGDARRNGILETLSFRLVKGAIERKCSIREIHFKQPTIITNGFQGIPKTMQVLFSI